MRDRMENEFALLWQRFDPELRETGGRVDMEVSNQNPVLRTVLTTISRLPTDVHARVAELQANFSRRFPSHYFYPPGDLHFTVRDCTAYVKNPESQNTVEINRLADRLNQIFGQFKAFSVELKGLNVFPTTVYLQLFDESGTLHAIRECINRELSKEYINTDIIRRQLLPNPLLGFVNVIRFRESVPVEFLDIIARLREVNVGAFKVQRIELVRTDKLLSKENTVVYQAYTLSS
jgi:2'-5' RNA ligase